MHTAAAYLRRGRAAAMVRHILDEGRRRGYIRLSLETGSMPFFYLAHALYRSFGFEPCPPFGPYKADPNSLFMTLAL